MIVYQSIQRGKGREGVMPILHADAESNGNATMLLSNVNNFLQGTRRAVRLVIENGEAGQEGGREVD